MKLTTTRAAARAIAATVLTLACATPLAAQQQRAPLSPRDTAEAKIGAATVMVDYSRPSKRGRQIFGALVPYGEVWRAGANEATTLKTSAALKLGNTTVPAGEYTLYAIPTQSAWTLVVNKQTRQWGTVYDQSRDLARIPMTAAKTAAPVEQFTIAVEPKGAGGVLAMSWDTTRAELPFTVAR